MPLTGFLNLSAVKAARSLCSLISCCLHPWDAITVYEDAPSYWAALLSKSLLPCRFDSHQLKVLTLRIFLPDLSTLWLPKSSNLEFPIRLVKVRTIEKGDLSNYLSQNSSMSLLNKQIVQFFSFEVFLPIRTRHFSASQKAVPPMTLILSETYPYWS
jgi:hypothetical protein